MYPYNTDVNHLNLRIIFCFLCLALLFPDIQGQGDRDPDVNYVFPRKMYYHSGQGNRILDITRPPFNAKADGVTDDTEAILSAIDFVMDKVRSSRHSLDARTNVIYFPKGTYLVSRTLEYSWGEEEMMKERGGEMTCAFHLMGQSKAETVIRLKNGAPGFDDPSHPHELIRITKTDFNNTVSGNFIENLTIHTGSGNPGSIGLKFNGANAAAVRKVNIVSGDGQGVCGLSLPVGATQGVYQDITVNGFDYGISVIHPHASSLSFEHITLVNQKKAGFYNQQGSCSVRKLKCMNSPLAILLGDPAAHLVLLERELAGSLNDLPAIELRNGEVFLRDISLEGYAAGLRKENRFHCKDPFIEEFVSGKARSTSGHGIAVSMNLPVEETPAWDYWEEDMEEWAGVKEYGAMGNAVSDDTDAIRKAMSSGKKVIYFEQGDYLVSGTIEIPATVRMVLFNYTRMRKGGPLAENNIPIFKSTGESEQPLILNKAFNYQQGYMGKAVLFEQASERTVVLKDINGRYLPVYRNSVPGCKVFFENVNGAIELNQGAKAWARYLNSENHYGKAQYLIEDTDFWVMGFKSEKGLTVFHFSGNSRGEILGGCFNEHSGMWNENNTALVNDRSIVSITAHFNGKKPGNHIKFETVLRQISDKGTVDISRTMDWPIRFREENKVNFIIPLLVSGI